jgi:HAD superfamily hydrolase (TIGR01509 family)
LTVLLAFDLMSTLLTDPFERAHEAATGRSMASLRAAGLMPLYHRLETAEITLPQYWRRLRDRGLRVDEDAFHRVRVAGYRWLPGMRELCAEYARAHRTVIASNCPEWAEPIRAEFLCGLDVGWFPSYRHGVRKPSLAYFTKLCAAFGVVPAQLVLVDDKPRNTDAVRRLGGRAVTFHSASRTRARLAELLGTPDVEPAGDPATAARGGPDGER